LGAVRLFSGSWTSRSRLPTAAGSPVVIPEGAGTVNSETGILPGLIFLLAVLRRFWARRDEALGSGIDPAGSTAKRPKVLDANAGRRTLFKRRGKVGGSRVLGWCGSRCVLQRRWPGWWTGPGGLSVIPSLPSVLGWFGPVVGSGHPRGAGCGCHSFALHGSRRLAARHPATTRLLIENCELIAA